MTSRHLGHRSSLILATVAAALMTLLVAATLAPTPAGAGENNRPMAKHAKTFRNDGILKAGCHNYTYRYKIDPPKNSDSWGLETILTDRRGVNIASGGVLSGADPKRGKSRLRFCRENTVPGTFKLRGYFTYKEGYDIAGEGWIKPTFFKLRLAD